MKTFDLLKKDVLGIISDTRNLLQKASKAPGFSDKNFEIWEKTCENIEKQMSEEIIRVAVVGPIKSGKSTFGNSVYKGDYLKRGAGVITSIVTRIRSGSELKAALYFKTWDEINTEINDAMLFSSFSVGRSDFDIRRSQDREHLNDALQSLEPEQLITNNARESSSLLLSSYLGGYERISKLDLSSESDIREYKGQAFQEHKEFVANDDLAVYLKDMKLEITSDLDDSNIEMADCQGSDSPNPLHLAMIQDYLLQTHFIIYVISSRTGLRQADIKFLSMIRKMGIMDNMLFVVNCDFSEHEHVDGLQSLIKKISGEIALLKSNPDIFVFSSLFNLFKEKEAVLSQKDKARFEQWRNENELVDFSNRETERFYASFFGKIREERYQLLLNNNVERLKVIASGAQNWVGISREVLTGDADAVDETIRRINHQQQKTRKITSMIRNTLDGGTREMKKELRKDIDSFFSNKRGSILYQIIDFIRSYNISYDQYEGHLSSSGFTQTLYTIYHEFRQNLNAYMAETINPGILGFIKEEEDKIKDLLKAISEPFSVMVADAVKEFNTTVKSVDAETSREALDSSIDSPDIETVKVMSDLKISPAVAVMRYSARMKTEAVLRFGFYGGLNFIRKVLKKPVQDRKSDAKRALKDGIQRMKQETEKSIAFHFKNYRENIKFQYVFKLADSFSNRYYTILTERFHAYISELTSLTSLVDQKRIDKKKLFNILKEIDEDIQKISNRINEVKVKIYTA